MKNTRPEPINGTITTSYVGRNKEGRSTFKQTRTLGGETLEESVYELLDSPSDMVARAAVDASSEEAWREIIAKQEQTNIDAERVVLS